MKIDTGIDYDHLYAYRQVGCDLYAAKTDQPLDKQTYAPVAQNILDAELAHLTWWILIEDDRVWLESGL